MGFFLTDSAEPWWWSAGKWVASFIAAGGALKVYEVIKKNRAERRAAQIDQAKLPAELHESQARAALTLAEAREKDTTSDISLLQELRTTSADLIGVRNRVDELRSERDKFRSRNESYERRERRRLLAEAHRPRVLYIDDDDSYRELLERKYRDAEFRMQFAEDGTRGLEEYDLAVRLGYKFKLIILDYSMPGLSGSEVAAQIREIVGDVETKILFYTAFPGYVVEEDAKRLGITAVIPKGHDPVVLESAILKALDIAK